MSEMKLDGRYAIAKKFVERMNKRREAAAKAKQLAAATNVGIALYGEDLSKELEENAALAKAPKRLLGILSGSEKNLLSKVASGKTDFIDIRNDKAGESLYLKVYNYFLDNGMPYGIAKAREGDPDTWMLDKLNGF